MLDGSGQRLQGRLLAHGDLHEAVGLVPEWMHLSIAVRQSLPAIWTRLLGQPGFNADVIEDLRQPPGQRLVGMGMAIALNAQWQRRLQLAPPAGAAGLVYEELLQQRYDLPTDKLLGEMNARGEVTFLVLHYHQLRIDMADPDTLETLGVAMMLFRQAHAGYRLRGLYQEGLPAHGPFLESMGFRPKTSHAGTDGIALYGLTREDAATMMPGPPVRDAFQFCPPRFGFSGAERRMLRLALVQMADADISDELGISQHSIKKLWRSIFIRVGDAMPDLFEDCGIGEEGTRGPEKRRRLMQYLRQHPEELRPYAPPRP